MGGMCNVWNFDLIVRNYRISCENTRMGGGVMV